LTIRYHSEDGSGIRSIDVSEPLESTDIESRYVALGQESGVVSVLEYSALRPEGLVSVPNAGATSRGSSIRVAALKNLMNLTLRVNKVLFHPSAQILAMSSNRVRRRVITLSLSAPHILCLLLRKCF